MQKIIDAFILGCSNKILIYFLICLSIQPISEFDLLARVGQRNDGKLINGKTPKVTGVCGHKQTVFVIKIITKAFQLFGIFQHKTDK